MAYQPIPLSVPVEKEEIESIDAFHELSHASTSHSSSHEQSSHNPTWDLSETTVSQSTQALSSFVRTLNTPPSSAAQAEKSGLQDGQIAGEATPPLPSGLGLEDLVAQCLRAPLDRWVRDHNQIISNMVQHQVNQKILALLRLWMDENLPKLLQESINKQLECLVERAKKNQA